MYGPRTRGQWRVRSHSHPDRVLAVFDAVEGPVVTSGDVADKLDCTTEAPRRTLEQLREEGPSRAAGLPVS